LTLTLLSPERKLFDARPVANVSIPSGEGEIEVLPEHAHMVGTLETGVFSFRNPDGSEELAAVSSGFFEVKNDLVIVMAEALELREEIDVERAKKAQAAAELKLNETLEPDHFGEYQVKLERSLIRQKVAKGER